MSSSPKLFHARTSQQSTIPSRSTILIFSGLLVFAIISFIFALYSFLTFGMPSYCCRNFEPRSVRVSWERIENVNDNDDDDKGGGEGEGDVGVGYIEMKRHKVTGFVGIQTGFSSTGRRRSLRRTWMPSTAQGLQRLEESTGLAFRFIIGRTNDKSKMVELKKEIDKYDDFLLIDTEEKYSKLPYKTVAFFKAAYALFDADFYVKADDDIYLRPDRLSLLLVKERSHSLTYLGCMKKGNVFTDPKMKWYEPLSPLLGKEYFLHAHGSIYALSANIVARLAALKNDSFRMFNNEDVTIGAWMLAMNVNHEDIRQLCEPKCTPYSIAVWDMPKCSGLCHPEKKLVQLHKNEACSKSPTLPSSDKDDD